MATVVPPEEAAKEVKGPPSESTGGSPPEEGLEILGTEPESFETSQGKITVKPMVMMQIAQFISVSDKIVPAIRAQLKDAQGNELDLNMSRILAADPENFFKAVAIACNSEVKVVENLLPDEFIKVVTKVFLVNLDFFVRTLPLAIGSAEVSVLSAVRRMASKGGVKQSKE